MKLLTVIAGCVLAGCGKTAQQASLTWKDSIDELAHKKVMAVVDQLKRDCDSSCCNLPAIKLIVLKRHG